MQPDVGAMLPMQYTYGLEDRKYMPYVDVRRVICFCALIIQR